MKLLERGPNAAKSARAASLGTKIALASVFIAVLLVAAFLPTLQSLRTAHAADNAQDRADIARARASTALRLVVDLETATRGFIITRERPFLTPWYRARRLLPRELDKLRGLVDDNQRAAATARSMSAAANSYLTTWSAPLLATARRDVRRAARVVATARGKRLVDAFRSRQAQLVRAIDREADARRRDQAASERRALTLGATGILVALSLVALFAAYLRRSIAAPLACLADGAGRLAGGDLSTRVRLDGPREFSDLAESFNHMAASIQSSRGKLETANAELSEARHQAEQANAGKSEFLSRMSHELRTPLNSIIGFSQLLEMQDLERSQRESVERIHKGGRHLLQLINEVLELSRIEAGVLGVSLEPVDANAAVAGALDLIGPLASERDIRIDSPRSDGHHHWVMADQQRLKQVLLNLLSNAVKYNRAQGLIEVSLDPRGDRLAIRVRDSGRGLTSEEIGRIFVPFERLGAVPDVEGTGLGLSLTKRLVDAMDGTLRVESEPGVGSTFSVEFPLARGRPATSDGSRRSDTFEQRPSPRAAARVLYIEDHSANIRLVEQIFATRPEVELVVAMQGRLGLDLARQHRPDLIILDLHLPDMKGEAVLERLRSEMETRAVPVVILSADATPRQVQRLLAAGADAYQTKPLDVREFLNVIDELLNADRVGSDNDHSKEGFERDGQADLLARTDPDLR